jgi:hypothetical protein
VVRNDRAAPAGEHATSVLEAGPRGG